MVLVHDVDDDWFVVYEGALYTPGLEQLVCSKCEMDTRAYVDGHWLTLTCRCYLMCIMICDGWWDC